MAEYIEREKLPQEVSADGMSDTAVAFAAGYNTCLEHVKSIPAADVRPVVLGKWVQDCDYHFRCSVCGDRYVVSNGNPSDAANGWNFCPNCGALMEERKE